MAAGSSYPAAFLDANNVVTRWGGNISFTDSTNQPSPGGSGNEAVAKDFAPTGLTGAVSASRYVGGVATVAPTTGTFAVGDYVISQDGRIWVCTVAGSPGTWVQPASVSFAPLASPTLTGTVTVPAAAAATSATKLADLSSYLTITSGALPQFAAWVSGTAQQNPVARQIAVVLAISDDGTNNGGTCAIAISPDNTTYTTVGTVTIPAGINNLGATTLVNTVILPNAWYLKLTFTATRITVAQSYYY